MSENNKKYGEAWRAELMKWRKSEIIDFLKDTLVCNRIHQWHYPSKGELPGKIRVICLTDYLDIWIGERIEDNTERYKWKLFTDRLDEYYGDDEIVAWQYLPESPEVKDYDKT